jgi:hypothetical protein
VSAAPAIPGGAGVFYFVLTDRFANGRTGQRHGAVIRVAGTTTVSTRRRSRIITAVIWRGLTQRLDYLKGLGVTAIWLTPPFRNKPVQSWHGWVPRLLDLGLSGGGSAPRDGGGIPWLRGGGARARHSVFTGRDPESHGGCDRAGGRGHSAIADRAGWPYRDAQGRPFDETQFVDNGLGAPPLCPGTLGGASASRHRPTLPTGEEHAKNPAWLNDVRFYHNRGNTDFTGEKSLHGDFVGLDDLFTERPVVVRGMIDIYRQWIELVRRGWIPHRHGEAHEHRAVAGLWAGDARRGRGGSASRGFLLVRGSGNR